jgi:chorismate lyase/3-hydroxybenzoate synthase
MITRGTALSHFSLSSIHPLEPSAPPLAPEPPPWVAELMVDARARETDPAVRTLSSGDLALVSIVVPGARQLDAERLGSEVAGAYDAVGRALRAIQRRPIRWWNYLPDPGEMITDALDRYMVFNAGRREGFGRVSRGEPIQPFAATASAVGIATDELVIHCLSSSSGGAAVENPRQTPAWQYSARYGPVPPTFSRATTAEVGGRRLLVVGGTASVVGEDSMHVGDVHAQLEETFCNIGALVSSAQRNHEAAAHALARMTDVRVYLTPNQPATTVHAAVQRRCPRARIEIVTASLCRPELLVEIEGLAEL